MKSSTHDGLKEAEIEGYNTERSGTGIPRIEPGIMPMGSRTPQKSSTTSTNATRRSPGTTSTSLNTADGSNNHPNFLLSSQRSEFASDFVKINSASFFRFASSILDHDLRWRSIFKRGGKSVRIQGTNTRLGKSH
jgi:hypothetical protein